MTWRVAESLLVLRRQIDAVAPYRLRGSDGTIGDASHASRTSDHNPWVIDNGVGVVTAIDITHDPAHGIDTYALAEYLRTKRDQRIKYVISNGRIVNSSVSPWIWRQYTGPNKHTDHIHISVKPIKSLYDSMTPWDLPYTKGPVPAPIPGRMSHIYATEFGGEGDTELSAYGGAVDPNKAGVSLPAHLGSGHQKVNVYANGRMCAAEVVDVGPWNINDQYWTTGSRPQAEKQYHDGTNAQNGRELTNPSGIDLTPAVMDALAVPGPRGTRSCYVDWEFATSQPQPKPEPKPEPKPDHGSVVAAGGLLATAGVAWAWASHHAIELGLWTTMLALIGVLSFKIWKGNWPWSSTGDQSPPQSPPMPQGSVKFSAQDLALLAQQLEVLQATSSPNTSASPQPQPLWGPPLQTTQMRPQRFNRRKRSKGSKSSNKRK